jgi:hypothetical protein
LAVLYFISAVLAKFITLPDKAKTAHHAALPTEEDTTMA